MAFDACMVSAITNEINVFLANGKVEKVLQPEVDEIVFVIHNNKESRRLSISASANLPRINITDIIKENPKNAPMFCMLLRKHLTGSVFAGAKQISFERVIELEFNGFDELGYPTKRYIIAEIMGKYSNIIFLDEKKKIISSIKIVDFTTSRKRQVLPGMKYELPPAQDKLNPLDFIYDALESRYSEFDKNQPLEKFFSQNILGISALTAREFAFRCKSNDFEDVKNIIVEFKKILENKDFHPILLTESDGNVLEYSSIFINQYGNKVSTKEYNSFSELIDNFFGKKEKSDRIKQKGNDILKILSNSENRLKKKIETQKEELKKCEDKDKYRLYGDIITSNIYQLSKGMKFAELINYYSEACETVKIPLDIRLSPSQNAQVYYKKYNKLKVSETELQKQITNATQELNYIYTVFDSASKAETEVDLAEIREELILSGYSHAVKSYGNYSKSSKKKQIQALEYLSPEGKKILVGKNNIQNDYITTKLAEKSDYWFHVKSSPGSHVVLLTNGEIPTNEELTFCCEIAAYYSSVKNVEKIPIDYTLIKNVKKPAGSKPGFVTFQTNQTAFVTPVESIIESHRVK